MTSKMLMAGIDPGKSGALVFLYPDNSVAVFDVPLQKVNGKEVPAYGEWARAWGSALASERPDRIVIEKVSAMPGQGVSSTFNFGSSWGFVKALAHSYGAAVYDPSPSAWKGKMSLLKADKNASREKVSSLLPAMVPYVGRAKDDGRAEAALLALYGRGL